MTCKSTEIQVPWCKGHRTSASPASPGRHGFCFCQEVWQHNNNVVLSADRFSLFPNPDCFWGAVGGVGAWLSILGLHMRLGWGDEALFLSFALTALHRLKNRGDNEIKMY